MKILKSNSGERMCGLQSRKALQLSTFLFLLMSITFTMYNAWNIMPSVLQYHYGRQSLPDLPIQPQLGMGRHLVQELVANKLLRYDAYSNFSARGSRDWQLISEHVQHYKGSTSLKDSQHQAKTALDTLTSVSWPLGTSTKQKPATNWDLGDTRGQEFFRCNRSHMRTDVCLLRGDVRVISGNSCYVLLYASDGDTEIREEIIRPYTRKWEIDSMKKVSPVILISVKNNSLTTNTQPSSSVTETVIRTSSCTVHHSIPAVLFSSGGYTGNPYHDFQDVLIPLFITSQHLKGEVKLIVSDFRDWWVQRYISVLRQLTNYKLLDLSADYGVHCFTEVKIGLSTHTELGIDPEMMPHRETMKDFQQLLYRALNSAPPLSLFTSKQAVEKPTLSFKHRKHCQLKRKAKLLIMAREKTRILLNVEEVVKLATKVGFEVTVLIPSDKIELGTMYRIVHASDVLLGVHGAALTHILFMRQGTVFIQIIPVGTDWPSENYYGMPAVKQLGLHYLGYKIGPLESTLSEKYGSNDPVVSDPSSFVAKGWETQKTLYLEEQNVRLALGCNRFRETLIEAMRLTLVKFPPE